MDTKYQKNQVLVLSKPLYSFRFPCFMYKTGSLAWQVPRVFFYSKIVRWIKWLLNYGISDIPKQENSLGIKRFGLWQLIDVVYYSLGIQLLFQFLSFHQNEGTKILLSYNNLFYGLLTVQKHKIFIILSLIQNSENQKDGWIKNKYHCK